MTENPPTLSHQVNRAGHPLFNVMNPNPVRSETLSRIRIRKKSFRIRIDFEVKQTGMVNSTISHQK